MHDPKHLEQLQNIRTPILYDAMEKFNVRSRTEGLMDTTMRPQLPSLGVMVGYATTGKIVGAQPPAEGERIISPRELWQYVQRSPGPNVMVVQDLDQPPARSCAWGDVAASIFLQLGCAGAVTNGGVRDLREVEALGFHLFAPAPVVGHAHTRYIEIDTPVTVGSLVVHPGDLIHGDEHGVMVVPKEIPLEKLIPFVTEFLASEKTIVDYCQQPDFNIDTLCEVVDQHNKRTTLHF